jgi:hypothetical protein
MLATATLIALAALCLAESIHHHRAFPVARR